MAGDFLNDFSMRAFHSGMKLYDCGRHENALLAFRYGLTHDPVQLRLHCMVVVTLIGLGRADEAAQCLQRLLELHPAAEAQALIGKFVETWKHMPDKVGTLPSTPDIGIPALSLSLLGQDGAFGNQIFQYAFAKLYTEKHAMRLELYDWIGRPLFGTMDAPITKFLPFILEIEYLREDLFSMPPAQLGLRNRDTQGYFQFHTRRFRPYRERFTSLFKPLPRVESAMQILMDDLRARGRTLVALHLRRGDAAAQGRMSPVGMYLDWLKALWPTLDSPVLFVATDDPGNVLHELAGFRPVTSEHIPMPVEDAAFYPDFYALTQADHLAIGNSTFSFAASMLNERARTFVRPDKANAALVPFDPWDADPIL
jgi:hypothetical protein